jgi:hypothetical protein
MDLNSYNLSYPTMINLMKMVDLGQISSVSFPKRKELSEVYRFIRDYLKFVSK